MADALDAVLSKYGATAPPGGGATPGDPIDSVLAKYGAPAASAAPLPPGWRAPDGGAAPEPEAPLWRSAVRGVLQGVTLGHADEIAGAIASALPGGGTYAQERDKLRAAHAEDKAANPWTYGGGELAGGVASVLVPGLGAAKGASLGAKVGVAAAQGAVAGEGYSEKPASDLAGIATDAGKGALLSGGVAGALGLAGRVYARAAPTRAAKHAIEDITEGASPVYKKRLGQITKKEWFQEIVNDDPMMRASFKDADEALSAVKSRLDDVGSKTKPIYEAIDKVDGGAKLSEILAPLSAEIEKAAKTGGMSAWRNVLEAKQADLIESAKAYAKANNTNRLPSEWVREWATNVGKEADSAIGKLDAIGQAPIRERMADLARDIINGRVKRVAEQAPQLAGEAEALTKINQKIATYKKIEAVLANREERARNNIGQGAFKMAKMMAGLEAARGVMAGNVLYPAAGAVAYGGYLAGRTADRAVTYRMAQLAQAARRGDTAAAAQLRELAAMPARIGGATASTETGASALAGAFKPEDGDE